MVLDKAVLKEVQKLKKDCIVLSHNYQIPEIQDAADFTGDSLGLCIEAQKVNKPYIMFAGVDFMAESAVMLNPEKTVIVPDLETHCPMAAMLPAKTLETAKEEHPDAAVVLYINTRIEARALADVMCTSANAVKIVKALPEKKILFGPDRNLVWHVQRHVREKEIIAVPDTGHCITHDRIFSEKDVEKTRKEHPEAELLIHPECPPAVQMMADYICSTEQMVKRARDSSADEFIIGTEVGMLYRLEREFPDKKFYPLNEKAVCRTMKMNTWEKFITQLREKKNVVRIDERIAEKARKSLERMLELSVSTI